MGIAFQIQDDVLNLVGDRDTYGKEIGGDIYEGKRTLMLVHLLRHCEPEERDRLTGFLGRPRLVRSSQDGDWVLERMKHYGSIEYARSVARHFVGATLHEFTPAYGDTPDTEYKQFLAELIQYMIDRNV